MARWAPENPENAGDECKQEAFGDELVDEAAGRCAESAADSHLAAAALRTDEQKAGNVNAGDEQQQTRAGESREQYGTDVAYDDLGERKHVSVAIAVVVRILALQLEGD